MERCKLKITKFQKSTLVCLSVKKTVLDLTIVFLLGFFLCSGIAKEENGFVSLFDGKTLKGWKQLGGKGRYEAKNGMIVGTTVKREPNSFLCTVKNYGDFILELEFRVDPGLNSGIQIRSSVYEKETFFEVKTSKGKIKKKKFPAGRVYGYQVEIDPSTRAYSGGIYDESRRGWLNNLEDNEPAQKAFKQNTWNKFRIEAKGDSLKTWINGVPAADLKDDMTASGFIGLQVHGSKSKEPLQVRWRNIKIKELK